MILGLLRRLLEAFGFGGRDDALVIHRSETFEIHDPATGAVRRYDDRSQLPPSVRRALDGGQSVGEVTESRTGVTQEYRVVDADGNLRVYMSLDEMPPEIRAMLGKNP